MHNIIEHFEKKGDDDLFKCVVHHSFNYFEGVAYDFREPYFKLTLTDVGHNVSIQLRAVNSDHTNFVLVLICESPDRKCDPVDLNFDRQDHAPVLNLVNRIRKLQRREFRINGRTSDDILKYII